MAQKFLIIQNLGPIENQGLEAHCILDTVNVLGQYILSNPYVVVQVTPGVHRTALTSVPLHKGS